MPVAPPRSARGWDGGGHPRPPTRGWVLPPVIMLSAITVAGTAISALRQDPIRPLDVVGILLLLGAPGALLVVRRRGLVAIGGTVAAIAAAAGYVALGYPWGPFFLPLIALVGLLASSGQRWLGRSAALGALLAVLGAVLLRGDRPSVVLVTVAVAWLAVALTVGEASLGRRERFREMRAARFAREQTAVAAERLRIAQELHDVLGHSLSAINVQAGVGLHLMDRDPEQARSALASIKASSGQALDEVRAVLGVLRADGEAPRAPAEPASLTSLGGVIDAARTGGLDVEADLSLVSDAAARASGDVGRTVHRLVQEALTNVRRHTTATAACVTLAVVHGGLEVVVHDDGPARVPAATPGFGLLGMGERVEASGGRLDVGPDPAGGFTVRAWLPLRAAP